MSRKIFLTIVACVALLIGCFALVAPSVLIEQVKYAAPSPTADVMARTVGVLLISFGVLNFLVRNHGDSPTMKSILIANALLQIGIMPIDPYAYYTGVFGDMSAFVPNTILHILVFSGFIYYLVKMPKY